CRGAAWAETVRGSPHAADPGGRRVEAGPGIRPALPAPHAIVDAPDGAVHAPHGHVVPAHAAERRAHADVRDPHLVVPDRLRLHDLPALREAPRTGCAGQRE